MDAKAKYEEMLMKLASEYPELEQDAMDLNSAMLDLDAPDVGAEDQEPEMDMEEDVNLEPIPEKKPMGKEEIPAELMDEEEEEGPAIEIELNKKKK